MKEAPRPAVIEHEYDHDEPLTNGYILVDSHVLERNEAADLCDMLLLLMECYMWKPDIPNLVSDPGIYANLFPKGY